MNVDKNLVEEEIIAIIESIIFNKIKMQNKKKLILVAVASVAIGAAMFAGQVKASSSWKDYFSENEANSLKKYVAEYIREQLKNNNKDWKGIISAKELDNGTINADKVDSTVAKKKVITLKINSLSEADKTTTYEGGIDTIYWKKISIPEINIENSPNVIVYEKEDFSYMTESLGSNYWKQYSTDFYPFTDGQMWMHFYDTDEDDPFAPKEFKIVVNY